MKIEIKEFLNFWKCFTAIRNALYREYTVVSIQVIGSLISIKRTRVGESNLLRPVT